MSRVCLTKRDIERKRPNDITRAILTYIHGDAVDHQEINVKTPGLFGHANTHSMQAEAGKDPLPEPGTITRDDISLTLASNLKGMLGISLLTAFQAVKTSKLRTLDIDSLTVEKLAESSTLDFDSANPGKKLIACELPSSISDSPILTQQLLDAGAPPYDLLVRSGGYAFMWSKLEAIFQAIVNTKGRALRGERSVEGAVDAEEAVDRYLRHELIPNAWQPLHDMHNDDIEVPNHDVIALYNAEGCYIGRVLYHRGLNAVIPKLYYTDSEVKKGKINLLTDNPDNFAGSVNISSDAPFLFPVDVGCDEPVFTSREYCSPQLRVPDYTTQPSVDTASLSVLQGVLCGSATIHVGKTTSKLWAIDGEIAIPKISSFSRLYQGYIRAFKWLDESDFPLLLPLQQGSAASSERLSFMDRHGPKEILPRKTVEFTERLCKKIDRDISEARTALEDPEETEAILGLILKEVSADRIDQCALTILEAVDSDLAEETGHLQAQVPPLLKRHPALKAFSLDTHLAILKGAVEDDGECADGSQVGFAEAIVTLVALASACTSAVAPQWAALRPSMLAVGMWLNGQVPLAEVHAFIRTLRISLQQAAKQKSLVDLMQAAVAAEVDSRERAKELGMLFAGNRVTISPSNRLQMHRKFSVGALPK
ncbi:hypothetical protein [Pseudomonas syringae]|uniref:Uncharacterized protein n=1 Tax=Pseudomonas syringae TaxID=317 RepID=A0A085VIX5_PSESX|nr:hypothetical protein [Pseudomonas syringae]KFE55388.1 hypothetical protein IV01_12225 [Pseudomonas syringae]